MKRRTGRAPMVRATALVLGVVALQNLAGPGPLQLLAGRWGPAQPAPPLLPIRANTTGPLTPSALVVRPASRGLGGKGRSVAGDLKAMSALAVAPVAPARPWSPSAEARRAAWRGWMQAQEEVSRECGALEAREQERGDAGGAETGPKDTARRRRLLVADRSGDLGWARMEAQVAATLARTPDEKYQAAVLLARIECDAGDPRAELEQARRLMALALRRRTSLLVLWRAARCNGLQPLAQRADAALRTLTHAAN